MANCHEYSHGYSDCIEVRNNLTGILTASVMFSSYLLYSTQRFYSTSRIKNTKISES
jgi:hypothetical protein